MQHALFPSPIRPAAPAPVRPAEGPASFAAYKGKTRIQCADCVLVNYQGTPWPVAAARWRRKTGTLSDQFVCSAHRIAEQEKDT